MFYFGFIYYTVHLILNVRKKESEPWFINWMILFVINDTPPLALAVVALYMLYSPEAPELKVDIDFPPELKVDIDFDAASKAWRKDTLADDPVALRAKQRTYWAKQPKRYRACTPRRLSRRV